MDKIPLPNTFELKEINEKRSELVIEPLFSGYGTTIGNALRRVLLSSMPGAAVKFVKIKGVDHEFTAMENVQEDVVDIILNLKRLNLKLHTDSEVRLTLKKKGKGPVTAADFDDNADVEVVNKDLTIATVTNDSAEFEMEVVADRDRGYIPTEARADEKKEIGMIAVDSIYTPVKNVGMKVENVRVGQVTTFERVTLDIETDGSIDPKEAVGLSSQILVDHFSLLLEKDLEPQTERTDDEEMDPEEAQRQAEEEFRGMSEVEAPAPEKKEEESEEFKLPGE